MKINWLEKSQDGDYVVSPLLPTGIEDSPYKLLIIMLLPNNIESEKSNTKIAHVIGQSNVYYGEVKSYCGFKFPIEYVIMPKTVISIDNVTVDYICRECSLKAEQHIIMYS